MASVKGYEVVGPGGQRGWWDGKKVAPLGESGMPMRSLRAGDQKSEDEDIGALQSANSVTEMLGRSQDQINKGELHLGPVTNMVSGVQNAIGMSTPNSRNYGSFRAGLEKLRNDSLRLNKGVQTEGDAQRAWNELLSNVNDEELVKQRLSEIEKINERAVQYRSQTINQRRASQNVDPLDTRKFTQGSERRPFDLSGGGSRDDIPFGAYYRDPQGNLRRNDNGNKGNPITKPANALNGATAGANALKPAGDAKRPSLDQIFGN